MTNYPHRPPGEAHSTLSRALVHPTTGEIVLQVSESGALVDGEGAAINTVSIPYATQAAMIADGENVATGTIVEVKSATMQGLFRKLATNLGTAADWRTVGPILMTHTGNITRSNVATPTAEGSFYSLAMAGGTWLVEFQFRLTLSISSNSPLVVFGDFEDSPGGVLWAYGEDVSVNPDYRDDTAVGLDMATPLTTGTEAFMYGTAYLEVVEALTFNFRFGLDSGATLTIPQLASFVRLTQLS